MRTLNPANPNNIGARPDNWTPTAAETGACSKAQIDALLDNALMVKSYLLDNQEIEVNGILYANFNTRLTGYKRVSMHELIRNASDSGCNSSMCSCFNRKMNMSDEKSQLLIRNLGSGTARICVILIVLYAKEEIVDDSGYSL